METTKEYRTPELEEWGSVVELTETGLTQGRLIDGDTKEGSVDHSQGQ